MPACKSVQTGCVDDPVLNVYWSLGGGVTYVTLAVKIVQYTIIRTSLHLNSSLIDLLYSLTGVMHVLVNTILILGNNI